jgi:transcriptional regulator with PAS, ATPase and Fis domain
MSEATGAMQQFNEPSAPGQGGGAGLLLLYAEAFANLPTAWPITQNRIVIGREPPADIAISVNAVSRRHAELVWERNGFTLRDLGSTNGTLVDGRLVTETRVEAGQEIRVGDAILKLIDQGIDFYARYRLDGAMQPQTPRRSAFSEEMAGGYQVDRIAAELHRIARSNLSVLVLGESGTGKEVVAREVHRLSGRTGEFAAINCAAIPGNLLESELFGFKRGAFSGADRDKPGLIKTAHGGTLLLDEIGDMPLAAQAKLLRVLQAHEVLPLGAARPEPVDVRVLCATHRDLRRMQQEEEFRPDLFARVNEYQLRLPPLRDRKEDLYMLLKTFLRRHGRPELEPTFRFMTAALHYDWPYNVRELEACAKRCIALVSGRTIDAEDLPDAVREEMTHYGTRVSSTPDSEEHEGRSAPSEEELRGMLQRHQGNVAAVGRELGKARMQVHRWLKRYDITLDDYR